MQNNVLLEAGGGGGGQYREPSRLAVPLEETIHSPLLLYLFD